MGDFDTRLESLRPGTVAVLGVPYDEASSYMRGPAEAPAFIRDALHSGSSNLTTECGMAFGTGT